MKCFNWKVTAALAAVGIGLYALAPATANAAIPLFVLAACPLSMLWMMRAMGSMGDCKTKNHPGDTNNEVAAVGDKRQSRS